MALLGGFWAYMYMRFKLRPDLSEEDHAYIYLISNNVVFGTLFLLKLVCAPLVS